ncbi:GNAT family N-acetyltransferase [Flavobacterium algicola]|uniref:GNAT family N-acetyltransferase n=1 Tax=Flavobacterium algicola TaxID=556529 RepID=UPI001EFC82C0|nr:GNAT family N-acetyltransferase [Flavobacterium algicola]MCG9793604.1 GNAT family N-acetyltransferase [Flavobacterium algicola]
MITIVTAGREDFCLIQKLAHQVWPVAYAAILPEEQMKYMLDAFYSENALIKSFDNGCQFVLVKEDETVLGFAGFEHFETKEQTKIHKLYLLPESQGKGIGKLLIEYIATKATEKGFDKLILNVNRFNKALHFYEKLGFSIVEEIDIEIGKGYLMEDYVMEKTL